MKTFDQVKNDLKGLIALGIDVALQGLKKALQEGTDGYNDLLLIEGRYQDLSRQLIQGTLGEEASQVGFNKIRKDLLAFIDGLQENHLMAAEGVGVDGKPDIYNGEILYRIPKKMKMQEEVKCLIRLAFDRKLILEDFDEAAGDVMKDIRISEVMGVELMDPMGKAFEIRTLHDTVQFVEKDLFTEWVYFVKPILEGVHDLVLKISIIEIKNGIERKRNVVLEEKVEIVTSVPPETGSGDDFQKAGLALSVSQSQQSKSPAPAPSNAPTAPAKGTSFQKIAPVLSAFLVLVIASFVIWNSLDGTPTDNGPVASLEEKKSWENITSNPEKASVEAFVNKYPESKHVESATQILANIEQSTWDAAIASNDPNQVRAYVNEYPQGQYTDMASSVIAGWEAIAVIDPNEEGDKPTKETTNPGKKGNKNNGKNASGGLGNEDKNTGKTPDDGMGEEEKERPDSEDPDIVKNDPKKKPGADGYTEQPKGDDTNPDEPVLMANASRLPIYKGCTNPDNFEDEKSCTSRKIGKHIKDNLTYPSVAKEKDIEGVVTIQFIVEKDGRVSNINYLNDIGGGCALEAAKMVQRLPKFIPGKDDDGNPVRVTYILPVRFKKR